MIVVNNVNAECDYRKQVEVNTKAANVTATIENKTKIVDRQGVEHPDFTGETTDENGIVRTIFFYLTITNLDEDIYVTVTSEDDDINETITVNDLTDGKYEYQVPDMLEIRKYIIKIYATNPECGEEEIRSIEVKSPMYNEVSGSRICDDNDAYYCQEFVTTPVDVDEYEILQKQEAKKQKEEEQPEEEQKNNKKYLYMIGIGIAVVLVIGIIVVIIIKIRRRKKQVIMGERL